MDLSYVHDTGYRDFAMNSAPGLLRILRTQGVKSGLVVDLGCGSGRWAMELNRAGYKVIGIDQSPAMIRLARRVAPQSQFLSGSFLNMRIPPCNAVTCIGECLNYCFDGQNSKHSLMQLFRRVYDALQPEGVLIFDVAGPDRVPDTVPGLTWREGPDWAVLASIQVERRRRMLRRHIICFRKLGQRYRRTEETHLLRLYSHRDLRDVLGRCGFRTRALTGYGSFRFPPGIHGILAIKPPN